MLNLRYLEEYVALARTLNYSRTAEQMYITQPALSRHVAMIEEEMGARLFERSTRSMSLTPADKETLEAFDEILERYRSAQDKIRRLSAGQSGSLVISSPYYWTSEHTEPIIMAFQKRYPDCRCQVLSCQPAEGFASMVRGESDFLLSISAGKDQQEELRICPVGIERLAAFMLDTHPLANRESVAPEELLNAHFVFLGEGYTAYNESICRLLAKHGLTVGEKTLTQQIDTLGLTIQQTHGVSIMPYGVRHMDRDYIHAIPISGDDFLLPMCLFYRTDNQNPLIPNFLQVALEAMREPPAGQRQ